MRWIQVLRWMWQLDARGTVGGRSTYAEGNEGQLLEVTTDTGRKKMDAPVNRSIFSTIARSLHTSDAIAPHVVTTSCVKFRKSIGFVIACEV
uniref:Uncharacterized protein n=1 Tax=Hyaloperonospora arabidopsidis (strain Emoy2) TaxID=559515 RepID=M4BBV5_HYAAE